MRAPAVCPQLNRAKSDKDLQMHGLAHLLGIIVGAERASRLARAVLDKLEEGIEETWYDRQMRRRYG